MPITRNSPYDTKQPAGCTGQPTGRSQPLATSVIALATRTRLNLFFGRSVTVDRSAASDTGSHGPRSLHPDNTDSDNRGHAGGDHARQHLSPGVALSWAVTLQLPDTVRSAGATFWLGLDRNRGKQQSDNEYAAANHQTQITHLNTTFCDNLLRATPIRRRYLQRPGLQRPGLRRPGLRRPGLRCQYLRPQLLPGHRGC